MILCYISFFVFLQFYMLGMCVQELYHRYHNPGCLFSNLDIRPPIGLIQFQFSPGYGLFSR